MPPPNHLASSLPLRLKPQLASDNWVNWPATVSEPPTPNLLPVPSQMLNQDDAQRLALIDEACFIFYNPQGSPGTALGAEQILAENFPTFSESTLHSVSNALSPTSATTPYDSVKLCRCVLENSGSPYSQTFAVAHLKTLLHSHFPLFSLEEKLELRTFVLTCLTAKENLEPFVASSLAQLFCSITKLGWLDADEYRNGVAQLAQLLQASAQFRIIGLQLYLYLVLEFTQQLTVLKSLQRHRKASSNFKDTQLLPILEHAVAALRDLASRNINATAGRSVRRRVAREIFATPEQYAKIEEYALTLMKSCLSFDFLGTSPDESSEDIGAIQIPSAWKRVVGQMATWQLVFECYKKFNPLNARLAMELRSLFNETEKVTFLEWILDATVNIMASPGLNDPATFHEFCRLLARSKTVYQVSELQKQSKYSAWIERVTDFSIRSFDPANWAKQSGVYVLTFWSKMALSAPTGNTGSQTAVELEKLMARVTQAFVTSRVESTDPDDPGATSRTINSPPSQDSDLSDEGTLFPILELLASVVRFGYKENAAFICSYFDAVAQQFEVCHSALSLSALETGFGSLNVASDPNRPQDSARNGGNDPETLRQKIELCEDKFAWLVSVIGAAIGGRIAHSGAEDMDVIDGGKAFQLINVLERFMTSSRNKHINEKLELALIFFLQNFRKSYIGDQSHRSSKVYVRLGELLGMNDQTSVLTVILQKLANNLKFRWTKELVITRSLQLFANLASGYTSARSLRKTEIARLLLKHHTGDHFPFLGSSTHRKSRTLYYEGLARLLFADDETSEAEFLNFVAPFGERLERLRRLSTAQEYRSEDAR
ncbi:hypothetical protein BDK51DRAFT_32228, partial [Blyttiomyces helicus]